MSDPITFTRYRQYLGDIVRYQFNFAKLIPSADTLSSVDVDSIPAGVTEEIAQRTTSGQKVYVAINSTSGTVGTEYLIKCQVTSSSGKVQSICIVIMVLPQYAGTPIEASAATLSGRYNGTLVSVESTDPTDTVHSNNLVQGVPVWTRVDVAGVIKFHGTLAGAFPVDKTQVYPTLVKDFTVSDADSVSAVRISDDVVELTVYDLGNNPVDAFAAVEMIIEVSQ